LRHYRSIGKAFGQHRKERKLVPGFTRKRCDARVKNPVKIGKSAVAVLRSPRCRAWAMPNGRCRVHGGASTGPKSLEGKARVAAAMVAGRRIWVERRRADGKKFSSGRKSGEAWITDSMRERSRAEARRLRLAAWCIPDRALSLALLQSAKGSRKARAKAIALLTAEMRRAIETKVEMAKAITLEMLVALRENR
jgi:hypothetical protein